ncbi:MAG: N-acetylmuramoyl-L-alanine amidase [Verrucomicrobia bacterium]|nr:N-acetylmuramoyl-L-alanine amidase [Verrucomicrobiota bacterium]
MPRAALRLLLVAPLLVALVAASQGPGRSAPTRPGAPAAPAFAALPRIAQLEVTRLGGIDHVSLREAAPLLGLRATWAEKERQLTLADASGKVVFEADSREVSFHGLRLFLGRPVVLRDGVVLVSKVDFERVLLARLRPALLGAPPPRPRVVALDPGHGGTDNGMENKSLGLKEKVLTLDVAQRVARLLAARDFTVVLTRKSDAPLAADKATDFRRRAEVANRAGADVFVSIHFNSLYPDTKTSGTETYTFTPQFQRSDRAWSPAERDDTERDAAPVNRYDAWSSLLGQCLHREIIGRLGTLDRGQKTMHSAVMRGLDCPAVLVESVFLSNDAEARLASTPAGRQRIADAIATGIVAYADAVAALQPKPGP